MGKANKVPEYLATGAVARRLGYSVWHVTELCRRGVIPAKKFVGAWRIRREDLERFIAQAQEGGEKEEKDEYDGRAGQ